MQALGAALTRGREVRQVTTRTVPVADRLAAEHRGLEVSRSEVTPLSAGGGVVRSIWLNVDFTRGCDIILSTHRHQAGCLLFIFPNPVLSPSSPACTVMYILLYIGTVIEEECAFH